MRFEVRFSEGFIERFPEEKREYAREWATKLVRMIMEGSFDKQVIGWKYGVDRIDLKPYFDPNAVAVFIDNEGKEEKLPLITALFTSPATYNSWTTLLKDYVKTYPFVNDELGNGSYPSIFVAAVERQDLKGLSLISFNPNVNPNEVMPESVKDQVKQPQFQSATESETDWTGRPALEMFLEPFTIKDMLLYHYEMLPSINETLCRFIDQGALITPTLHNIIYSTDRFGRCRFDGVQKYLHLIKEHLGAVGPDTCSVQDFKHAYATQELNPWFIAAAKDERVAEHMLSIKEQLPKWLQDELQEPFRMLEAGGWEKFVDAQPRASWAKGSAA